MDKVGEKKNPENAQKEAGNLLGVLIAVYGWIGDDSDIPNSIFRCTVDALLGLGEAFIPDGEGREMIDMYRAITREVPDIVRLGNEKRLRAILNEAMSLTNIKRLGGEQE